MELRQLRYFVTVAEELHFGRAADRLQITQPALSKQVASLEKALSIPLLLRTKRTVQLTHAGQVFLEQARQLLNQAEAAIQLARRADQGEIGQLTIGFTETAAHTVLPQWVRTFRQRHPGVKITMLELATEAQVAALRQGQIDLAFLHPPIDERGLQLHSILEESFVAVLPERHPLQKYESIPIAALADEALIIHPRSEGPALYDAFIQVCHEAGFQPKIVQESISLQARVCLAAAGIGITFTSDRLQCLVGNNVACRPLANCPIRLKFAAVWPQKSINPKLNAFLKVCQEKL
ncbi:MAG: LysR substrate-binding domain-containing protein [Leptolyngbyaceae cyanobacterium]